ncbi:MAG: efflux RND transporter permease subunit [Bryobacteraceae bacterium]
MIERIIEFSARNRALVLSLVAAAAMLGWWSMKNSALDAIPDLSDTQVIVYSQWDRSPNVIEDQLTYPIVSAMLGAPKVKAVRGFSDFGYSFVYVVFEDGADIYWARTRTSEYLAPILSTLPEGAKTEIGPDATGLGWVFQYVLEDSSGKHNLAELRSLQDWYLRYHLKSVPGVAEVAPIGGFGGQFQVNVDPNRLRTYGITMNRVVEAIRTSNKETGGRMIEFGGAEYMVRGRGYAQSARDIEDVALAATENGSPVRVKDVGHVTFGPDIRRGAADLDGQGDAVSGIVVMRQGENALHVIDRVKAKIREIEPGLPAGVRIVPVYDRSQLIRNSIDTLRATVIEVVVTVSLIVLVFLWHAPSALIPILTIPVAVLIAFIPFRGMGLTANIMSLGGIAIAIGAMVDASIVLVEQAHKKLEVWQANGQRGDYREVVIQAVKEVGAPSFFALLVIAVAFIPVLALEAQEGRLFKPLAYTKTLGMVVAAVLAITLDPALRVSLTHVRTFVLRPAWFSRIVNALLAGRVHSEDQHPVSRALIRLYEPACRWTLRNKWTVMGAAAALMAATVPVYFALGSEFMPPLYEEALFYMPSSMPGISIGEAQRVLQVTDRVIKSFPEVDRVLGKAGRAQTATDPAPLSMFETVITLKPRSQWRRRSVWYSSWAPEWTRPLFRRITADTISPEQLVEEMNRALNVPGLSNAWTMPIKARIDMLSTGMRTPVGVKVQGDDLAVIEKVGMQVESVLPSVRGTRSVFAERTAQGYFLDVAWNRQALARYGISLEDAQAAVQNAIGGENVSTVVSGRARYPVNVRYMRDFRSDFAALGRVLVAAGGDRQIPLSDLAEIRPANGPAMIRNENGMLTGYVYVDVAGRDPGGYVREAQQVVRDKVKLPPGFAIIWSGQYEAMERVNNRLMLVLPVTAALILLLLYLNTRSAVKTAIVVLAVPFSAIGAIWFLYLLGYNLSVGVWVGLIALLGVDAETGVFMLLYLDLSYEEAKRQGRLNGISGLREAIVHGAVKRIRPKFMTVATDFIGLVPILWAAGTGSDVMKRIAAPLVGGVFSSFLLELLVYPAIYELWKWHFDLKKRVGAAPAPASLAPSVIA